MAPRKKATGRKSTRTYGRAQATPPPTADIAPILVYHPGFDRIMLRLGACELLDEGAQGEEYGLPLALVVHACSMLADNEPGSLYPRQDGPQIETVMLPPGQYVFRLEGETNAFKYKLRYNFNQWQPSEPPPEWLQGRASEENDIGDCTKSAVSERVKSLDAKCAVSGVTSLRRLESAHLVPPSAGRWFKHHCLNQKAGDTVNPTVDSPNNRMTLRAELNGQCIDQGDFCIYLFENKWRVVWMGEASHDVAYKYHMREVDLPQRIRATYLWARLAWNTYLLAKKYLDVFPKYAFHDEKGLESVYPEEDDDGSSHDGSDDAPGRGGGDKAPRNNHDEHGGVDDPPRDEHHEGGGGDGHAPRRSLRNQGGKGARKRADVHLGAHVPMDDAPEIVPSKKRRAVELGEMALKKRRLHGEVATHDVPDLSSLTRRSLRGMTATDRLFSSGHLPYLGHPE
ncbi:hypothetical protein C8J57DRAFT_1283647 [Mycena rebaudengoi]|nr:hypothetical protein C8J57DRAFT_1283647 [Mycena rebaudengoi]